MLYNNTFLTAVIMFPQVNQVGTVTEAIEAVKLAKDAKWGVVISQRSGESEDSFLADLAVGLATGQIKAGAPCRGERLAKYNQVDIYNPYPSFFPKLGLFFLVKMWKYKSNALMAKHWVTFGCNVQLVHN